MITEKEIYDTPELKTMLDKIKNYSSEIANLITETGIERATLKYLSEHEFMFDDLIKEFIKTNAETKWYKLYFDNFDNVSAKREISIAYSEHIDPEYVKEYINTSSDELELEEKRSHYKEWSKENETSSASRETPVTMQMQLVMFKQNRHNLKKVIQIIVHTMKKKMKTKKMKKLNF